MSFHGWLRDRVETHRFSHIVESIIIGTALYPLTLGVAILLVGANRFTSPGLRTAELLLPHWGWGLLFMLFGANLLAARVFRRRRLGLALFVTAFPFAFFDATLWWNFFQTENASATGCITYFWISVGYVFLGVRINDAS